MPRVVNPRFIPVRRSVSFDKELQSPDRKVWSVCICQEVCSPSIRLKPKGFLDQFQPMTLWTVFPVSQAHATALLFPVIFTQGLLWLIRNKYLLRILNLADPFLPSVQKLRSDGRRRERIDRDETSRGKNDRPG